MESVGLNLSSFFVAKELNYFELRRTYGTSEDNAWVDERVMLRWLQSQWQVAIDFQAYPGQYTLRNTIPRMLVLDVHKAQRTQAVKDVMHRMHTVLVLVVPH